MVRRGGDEWFAVVKWVIYGLLEAEEYGITRANVDSMKTSSQDLAVQRILGATEDSGKLLGLDKDWMARAIKTSGNYGELFERTYDFGKNTTTRGGEYTAHRFAGRRRRADGAGGGNVRPRENR